HTQRLAPELRIWRCGQRVREVSRRTDQAQPATCARRAASPETAAIKAREGIRAPGAPRAIRPIAERRRGASGRMGPRIQTWRHARTIAHRGRARAQAQTAETGAVPTLRSRMGAGATRRNRVRTRRPRLRIAHIARRAARTQRQAEAMEAP